MTESLVFRALAVLAAVLGIACLAAIWSMAALLLPGWAPWMAPLIGLVVVLWLRYIGFQAGARRSMTAACLYFLAVAYAAYMEASANIAGQLGLGLAQGLKRVGIEMAVAWHSARWHTLELALYLVGWLLAVVLGGMMGRASALPAGRVRRKR